MTGSTDALLYAILSFVGTHLALAAPPIRPGLTAILGENGFRLLYSIVAGLTLAWVILAYGAAPYAEIWFPPAWAQWVPNIVMPIVCVLLVCSLTSPNPTMVGGEIAYNTTRGPTGILTVTRHPMLWAFGLWGAAHLPPNGDLASLYLFGGMSFLAVAGMIALDAKKREAMGAEWGPIAMRTSVIPFVAIMQGRSALDWNGIGWRRIVGGLVLWAVIHGAHPLIAGVPALVLH